MSAVSDTLKVADLAWLGTALMHREHPDRESFRVKEIIARLEQEHLVDPLPPGVEVHIRLHGVANVKPNPARYRMLYALPDGTRRLFRAGDATEVGRTGKMHPDPAELPDKYRTLVDYYLKEYVGEGRPKHETDPILRMRGVGKHLWAGVDGVEYQDWVRGEWDSPEQSARTDFARKTYRLEEPFGLTLSLRPSGGDGHQIEARIDFTGNLGKEPLVIAVNPGSLRSGLRAPLLNALSEALQSAEQNHLLVTAAPR